MKKTLLIIFSLFTIISYSQCNDLQYEILFETYSGEWAEEITWSIIDNNGELVVYFNGSETENNTFYNQTSLPTSPYRIWWAPSKFFIGCCNFFLYLHVCWKRFYTSKNKRSIYR